MLKHLSNARCNSDHGSLASEGYLMISCKLNSNSIIYFLVFLSNNNGTGVNNESVVLPDLKGSQGLWILVSCLTSCA